MDEKTEIADCLEKAHNSTDFREILWLLEMAKKYAQRNGDMSTVQKCIHAMFQINLKK